MRYVNGLYVAGTTNGILVSSNAQQWAYRPVPVPAFLSGGWYRIDDVAFGQGRMAVMATSSQLPGGAILSSADGFDWIQGELHIDARLRYNLKSRGIAFGNGRFAAVQEPRLSGEERFLSSVNAQDWTPSGPNFSALDSKYRARAVTFGNGLFFAAGNGCLFRSTNGSNWSIVGEYVFPIGGPNAPLWSIAYGAGRVVAIGDNVIRVSTNNGTTWSGYGPGWDFINPLDANEVAYGSGTFVAVGRGAIFQSAVVEEALPFFITIPTNQFVQHGTTATLRSKAVGSEPLTYQWFKNGLPVLGGTNASLVISNAQTTDTGSYSIVVSSPYGSTTNPPVLLSVVFAKIASYVGLTIDDIPGRTYRVEYLDALESSSQWQTLTNFVLPLSPYVWIDYETRDLPMRFFRPSAKIARYAGLTIDGTAGRTYRVEYANSLEPSSEWLTLTNIVLPLSPYIWIDYETPVLPNRSYRALESP